jgi:hypothetical protein
VAAVVLAIAGVVVGGVRTHHAFATDDRLSHELTTSRAQLEQRASEMPTLGVSAVTAAQSYAIDFATYTYDNLDAAFAKTESHSVDPFLSQYRNETAQLRATLVKAKASSSATIVSAGLVSLTATSAVVDLFLNQSITNSSGNHVDAQRVQMTLQFEQGEWLISKVVLP